MTASGPFAMGPAMAGSAGSRRSTPRSNFAPSIAPSTSGSSSLGAGLSKTAPPSLRKDLDLKGKGKEVKVEDDEEVYSDQDDGVEIIDIDNVRTMDWMAPETIRRERKPAKKVKKEKGEPETGEFARSSGRRGLKASPSWRRRCGQRVGSQRKRGRGGRARTRGCHRRLCYPSEPRFRPFPHLFHARTYLP